jgi:hypothetical protein
LAAGFFSTPDCSAAFVGAVVGALATVDDDGCCVKLDPSGRTGDAA